jgi:lysophospholipase L1-like esterase
MAMFYKGTRFVFQGDSITDGGRRRTGDLNHVYGHGYMYLIASRLGADYPDRGYEFYNRGVSGERSIDLPRRWKDDTLDLRPDVLSVLVGVNDIFRELIGQGGASPEQFEASLELMIGEARAVLPRIRILICEPFFLPVGERGGAMEGFWREEIGKRQEIARSVARSKACAFAPLQGMFEEACGAAAPEYWIWDGIHPTAAGHELIARAWLAAALGSIYAD